MTVEAVLTRKKEHVYHAAMLDPHTAAELSVDDIWKLVDDLLEAHEGMIPKLNWKNYYEPAIKLVKTDSVSY